MKTMRTSFGSINNFMYFGHNFDYDFIFKVWGGTYGQTENSISKHLYDKFNGMSSIYGTMTFFRWFMELDDKNKQILCRWIDQNYNG